MTRDEHRNAIQQLIGMVASEHQAAASELLTNLSEDYEATLTNFETSENTVRTLTANNETLRDVNAKLFLKVGSTNKEVQEEAHTEPEGKPLPFEELFNEKGELI